MQLGRRELSREVLQLFDHTLAVLDQAVDAIEVDQLVVRVTLGNSLLQVRLFVGVECDRSHSTESHMVVEHMKDWQRPCPMSGYRMQFWDRGEEDREDCFQAGAELVDVLRDETKPNAGVLEEDLVEPEISIVVGVEALHDLESE